MHFHKNYGLMFYVLSQFMISFFSSIEIVFLTVQHAQETLQYPNVDIYIHCMYKWSNLKSPKYVWNNITQIKPEIN